MSRAESDRPARDRGPAQIEIERLRTRIDAVDDAILAALNERAELVLEVGREKQVEGSSVYEPTRERRIVDRLREQNAGPFPSEGLAPVIVQMLARTIRMLRERGFTIVMVEQNFRFAAPLADRLYVMERGRIVESLAAAELAPKMGMLHEYLGV